jgi:hypothetical protein
MLVASDRAARGASIEVRLVRPRAREADLCLAFAAGMVKRPRNVLMCGCCVMMSQRGLGALWEVWGRVYLLTREGWAHGYE